MAQKTQVRIHNEDEVVLLCYERRHYMVTLERSRDPMSGFYDTVEKKLINLGVCNDSCNRWRAIEAKATQKSLPKLFLVEIGLLTRANGIVVVSKKGQFMRVYVGDDIIQAEDAKYAAALNDGDEILLTAFVGPTYYANRRGHLITEPKANRDAKERETKQALLELAGMGLSPDLAQKVYEASWKTRVWSSEAAQWAGEILKTVPRSDWKKALPRLRAFSQAHRPVDSEDWYEGELERLVARLKLPPLPSSTLLVVNPALLILEKEAQKS